MEVREEMRGALDAVPVSALPPLPETSVAPSWTLSDGTGGYRLISTSGKSRAERSTSLLESTGVSPTEVYVPRPRRCPSCLEPRPGQLHGQSLCVNTRGGGWWKRWPAGR